MGQNCSKFKLIKEEDWESKCKCIMSRGKNIENYFRKRNCFDYFTRSLKLINKKIVLFLDKLTNFDLLQIASIS